MVKQIQPMSSWIGDSSSHSSSKGFLMLSVSFLSKFEIFLLWRVLLHGPISVTVLAEDLGVPLETAQFFVNRLTTLRYIERDINYAHTKGHCFVSSQRRDTDKDLDT